jgi:succinate dehydrogenase/fumarate reductase cytochrome b subunit
LALAYPGAVWLLFRAAGWARDTSGFDRAVGWLGVAAALALCAGPSVAAFASLRRNSGSPRPRWTVDLLAFGTPALYTLLRVLLASAQTQLDDALLWGPAWVVAMLVASRPGRAPLSPARAPEVMPSKLQVAHGVGAAAVLTAFLLVHVANQALGLLGVPVHEAALQALRRWYRAAWVEPLLLAAFGFLVVSGVRLLGRRRGGEEVGGPWPTLQLATGAGLVPFILAHVTVVLGARALLHVETDWAFASGGAEGLLGSLGNTRLLPYYWLAVFAVVAHVGAGLRVVLLAHRWRRSVVDRLALVVTIAGALGASTIVAALCGLRLGG